MSTAFMGTYTGCEECDDAFCVPPTETLTEHFRRRDYYALYTGYSPNHPMGDTILCSTCRTKAGLPAQVASCQCDDCTQQWGDTEIDEL